jgi:hypothetical protein
MSTSNERPSTSRSNFNSIFQTACDEYKRLTRFDLATHPFVTELQDCSSPDDVLEVLKEQAQTLTRSRRGDEKLLTWLNPIVYVLFTFSATLGEGIGLVSISHFVSSAVSLSVNIRLLAIFTRQDNFHRHRCSSWGTIFPILPRRACI